MRFADIAKTTALLPSLEVKRCVRTRFSERLEESSLSSKYKKIKEKSGRRPVEILPASRLATILHLPHAVPLDPSPIFHNLNPLSS